MRDAIERENFDIFIANRGEFTDFSGKNANSQTIGTDQEASWEAIEFNLA